MRLASVASKPAMFFLSIRITKGNTRIVESQVPLSDGATSKSSISFESSGLATRSELSAESTEPQDLRGELLPGPPGRDKLPLGRCRRAAPAAARRRARRLIRRAPPVPDARRLLRPAPPAEERQLPFGVASTPAKKSPASGAALASARADSGGRGLGSRSRSPQRATVGLRGARRRRPIPTPWVRSERWARAAGLGQGLRAERRRGFAPVRRRRRCRRGRGFRRFRVGRRPVGRPRLQRGGARRPERLPGACWRGVTPVVGVLALKPAQPSGGMFAETPGGSGGRAEPPSVQAATAKAVEFTTKMSIDLNGVNGWCTRRGSRQRRPRQTLQYPEGKSLNPGKIPFVVIPLNFASVRPEVKLGDYAAVTYGGKTVYAIVGDYGPLASSARARWSSRRGSASSPDPGRGGVGSGVSYTILMRQRRDGRIHATPRDRGQWQGPPRSTRVAFPSAERPEFLSFLVLSRTLLLSLSLAVPARAGEPVKNPDTYVFPTLADAGQHGSPTGPTTGWEQRDHREKRIRGPVLFDAGLHRKNSCLCSRRRCPAGERAGFPPTGARTASRSVSAAGLFSRRIAR